MGENYVTGDVKEEIRGVTSDSCACGLKLFLETFIIVCGKVFRGDTGDTTPFMSII